MAQARYKNLTAKGIEQVLDMFGMQSDSEELEILRQELPQEFATELIRLLSWSERIVLGRNAIMNNYESMHLLNISAYKIEVQKLASEMPENGGKLVEFWCEVRRGNEIYMVLFTDSANQFMKLSPGFTVRKYTGTKEPQFGSIAMIAQTGEPYEWEDLPNTNPISREVIAISMYAEAKSLNRNTEAISGMLQYFPPQAIENV